MSTRASLAALGPPYTTVVAATPLPSPERLLGNDALAAELGLPSALWHGAEATDLLAGNRIDDIDEAIVSRCIALIRYHAPDQAARERIWRVMADQFALPLDAVMVSALASRYPQASGRDIKGLAKLVATFCAHKGALPTLDVFARCAMFRALEDVSPKTPAASPPRGSSALLGRPGEGH